MGGIAGPALQGIMTNQVPANEQGELQGGLTSLMSLSSIFGPWFMTYIFYYFTNAKAPVYLPGAPYFVGAALMLLSAFLAMRNQNMCPDRLHLNSSMSLVSDQKIRRHIAFIPDSSGTLVPNTYPVILFF
eukprot:gene12009-14689_t